MGVFWMFRSRQPLPSMPGLIELRADEDSNQVSKQINARRGLLGKEVLLLLRFASWRHALARPFSTLGLLFLLALGVGTYLSLAMASRGAVSGFQGFTEVVSGGSDYVLKASGGPLPDTILRELRGRLGNLAVLILPVLETTAVGAAEARVGESPALQRLVGLDYVSLRNAEGLDLQGRLEPEIPGIKIWDIIGDENWVFAHPDNPLLSGKTAGNPIELIVGDALVEVRLAGWLPKVSGAYEVPRNVMLIDIRTLQEFPGLEGKLSRVEFLVESGADSGRSRLELAERLQALAVERHLDFGEPENARERGEKMTRAFRYNLTVLSLIALLVALYLIVMALDAAVVRRRTEIAVQRSIGFSVRAIRMSWLMESAVFGFVGGGMGILLAWGLAQFSVRGVGRTIDALYQNTVVGTVYPGWSDVVAGFSLGIIGALLAGIWPALDAARTPPAQLLSNLHAGTRLRFLESAGAGLCLVLAGGLAAWVPVFRFEDGSPFPLGGYAAAILWLIGGTFLAAWLLPRTARLLRRKKLPVVLLFPLSRLAAANSRHQLALAGLLISVAMAGAMGLLVGSFGHTLRHWIEGRFEADIFVSSAGFQGASSDSNLSPATLAQLTAHEGIERSDPFLSLRYSLGGRPTFLNGVSEERWENTTAWSWVERPKNPLSSASDQKHSAFAVLINESFGHRFAVEVGQHLSLLTPSGIRTVEVAGVFADYGNELGSVNVPLKLLQDWFSVEHLTNVSLYVREGWNAEEVRQELLNRFPALRLRTNEELRTRILIIFDQTFGITYALQAIALLVAVCGVSLAQATLLQESQREWATLRSLGASRRILNRMGAIESSLLALVGCVVGLFLAAALGWLLIYVINRQSFGWTLQWVWPWFDWFLLVASVMAAVWTTAFIVCNRFHR